MNAILKLITENPHRIMGAFSNSSIKEINANKSKILAFSKIGKDVSFPNDLTCIMPPITRTTELINNACIRLLLPMDRIKHIQFWFLQIDEYDTKALEKLYFGDIDKALQIWSQHESLSSLQNQMLCYFLQQDTTTAITTAETLYEQYGDCYLQQVYVSDTLHLSGEKLAQCFIDAISEENDMLTLWNCCHTESWKEYLKSEIVQSCISELSLEVDQVINTKYPNPDAMRDAGEKLMNSSREPLHKLEKLLTKYDMEYQHIADKVGLQIFNCGMFYINESTTDFYDKVQKSIDMIQYAKNTVVGKSIKQHCIREYEKLRPWKSIDRGDYRRAKRAFIIKKIRIGLVTSMAAFACFYGMSVMEGFSGPLLGLLFGAPICIITNRFIKLFE